MLNLEIRQFPENGRQLDQIRQSLASRKSSSLLMKKLNHQKPAHCYGPGINGSDSSNQPLGQAKSSMPKFTNSGNIFKSEDAVRDGVLDIDATYQLI